ncbi:hypothetical protein HC776_00410 [bacterium]|nr:hypothetical protein [bacterium]
MSSDSVGKIQHSVTPKQEITPLTQEVISTPLHPTTHAILRALPPNTPSTSTRSQRLPTTDIVQLQRLVGNRMIQRLINQTTTNQKEKSVQRRAETINLGGGWGTERGSNRSNMVFNPHATLYINGRQVQSTWFSNNPAVTDDSFNVTPNSRGVVRISVDAWWLQDNSTDDNQGNGQASVDFEFFVNGTGQITIGNVTPSINSQGSAASLSITANPATANGTIATLSVVAQIAASEDVGVSTSTGASIGIGSTEVSASRSSSQGIVRSRTYHINLFASVPASQPATVRGQTERMHSVLFATNRPRENESIDHLLSDQQYQRLVRFMATLNSETRNQIQQGQRPVTIVGRASNAGGIGMHNQNLSHRRAEAVKTVLRQIFPQIQFSNVSGAVGALGTTSTAGDAQGRSSC